MKARTPARGAMVMGGGARRLRAVSRRVARSFIARAVPRARFDERDSGLGKRRDAAGEPDNSNDETSGPTHDAARGNPGTGTEEVVSLRCRCSAVRRRGGWAAGAPAVRARPEASAQARARARERGRAARGRRRAGRWRSRRAGENGFRYAGAKRRRGQARRFCITCYVNPEGGAVGGRGRATINAFIGDRGSDERSEERCARRDGASQPARRATPRLRPVARVGGRAGATPAVKRRRSPRRWESPTNFQRNRLSEAERESKREGGRSRPEKSRELTQLPFTHHLHVPRSGGLPVSEYT